MSLLGRWLQCDGRSFPRVGAISSVGCQQHFPAVMNNIEETRRLAARQGWGHNGEEDLCPKHAEELRARA